MIAEDNGDGTYTCEINTESSVGSYTAATASIVMPVNTPGYSAMAPLTSYSSFTEYTDEGFVYVHAGCRGRDSGAPAGVTDLKAAVRYIRYTDDVLPGNAESIFTFELFLKSFQQKIRIYIIRIDIMRIASYNMIERENTVPKRPREMEKEILDDGWIFMSQEGSHRHYVHPTKPGKVTIPFHSKELSKIVEKSIRKQAGLDK